MSNNIMIATLWNNDNATLIGFGDGYAEAIDRDQAVDDDGKAVFESYAFTIGDGYEQDMRMWAFTAEDIENYARTW